MASKQQKEMKKRKEKERDSRKKVLAKREQLRKQAKEARQEYLRDKRIAKLQREMDRLDVNLPENVKELPDEVLTQIEHNAKILAALEQEHEEETKKKRELNQGLEEQGHSTLDAKVRALRQNFFQQEQVGVGGAAECRMNIAPPQPRRFKDVSDVEVIKAPVADVEVIKAPEENS